MGNELIKVNLENEVLQFGGYSSFKVETENDQIALYNAMNGATYSSADLINQEFLIKNVMVDQQERTDEMGITTKEYRVILFNTENESVVFMSKGIFKSIKAIIAIAGVPEKWDAPKRVKVVQTKVDKGNMLSLELLPSKTKK